MQARQSIEKLIKEYELIEQTRNERSDSKLLDGITFTNLTIIYTKYFALSCASYFEEEFNCIIEKIVSRVKDEHAHALASKFSEDQFFKVFDVRSSEHKKWSANKFYVALGIKEKIDELKNKPDFKNKERAFLSIINTRNNLVHNNFIEYNLETSFQELKGNYLNGIDYLDMIKITMNLDENNCF